MLNNIDWFFVAAIGLTVVFGLIVLTIIIRMGKVYGLISGLLLGTIGLVILLTLTTLLDIDSNDVEYTMAVLTILSTVFITLISIVLPFYIFLVIINFILGENIKRIKARTFFVSFGSLLGLALFGIIIGLILTPIILGIPNEMFGIFDETDQIQQSGLASYFTDWRLIILMIIISITTGIILKISYRKNKYKLAKVESSFSSLLAGVTHYFEYIVKLVPFVIMTRMMSLGLMEMKYAGNTFKFMGIYMGIFWLGAIIIFSTLFIGNILLSKNGLSIKERVEILSNHCLIIFGTQSLQASLPQTQMTTRKLGVSNEISQLTPTNGTIMGMVMCNGFTPMIVILLSLMNDDMLTVGNMFFAALLIFAFSISSSGSGSADYTIIFAVLSIFGISTGLYLTVIMPMQEINETTITKPTNSLGHIFATQITEISYRNNHK